MKVLITIQHPAHVHFYRRIVDELRGRNHDVRVFVRNQGVAVDLLDQYDIPHTVLAGETDSLAELAVVQLLYELRLFRAARRFDPDVMTAIGGVAVAHVAPLVGARSVVWIDNEGAQSHRITAPVADVVCTPRRFRSDHGDKQVRYDGYHELAYLHPSQFEPDADRLREHGVDPSRTYFFVRFRDWCALHDVGQGGFSETAKRELISALSDRGDLYISSQSDLPPEFDEHRLPVPSHLVHDLLYHADLYVGDSATMATEAAVVGTPAVRCQSFADQEDMTNFVELEEYGLLYSTADETDAIDEARAIASGRRQVDADRHREAMLADKIDVTEFATNVLLREGEKSDRAGLRGVARKTYRLVGR